MSFCVYYTPTEGATTVRCQTILLYYSGIHASGVDIWIQQGFVQGATTTGKYKVDGNMNNHARLPADALILATKSKRSVGILYILYMPLSLSLSLSVCVLSLIHI